MDDLFNWMKEAQNSVHPLVLSSVFHYEFVFIHPFSEGIRRMGQTNVILKISILYLLKRMDVFLFQKILSK